MAMSSPISRGIYRQLSSILRSGLNAVPNRSNEGRYRLEGHARQFCTGRDVQPNFGILFDIDGVLMRGRRVLPEAIDAFKKLTDTTGSFRVPVVFVTNAGNSLRQDKAKQLSANLRVQVSAEQVVMSHSPLKIFEQFHDKHILVCGQGPIKDIAKFLGFKNITTVDEFRECFPLLDMVDHKRRKSAPCAFEAFFPKIEAIVLLGEPVRWETSLQLILDCLLTTGQPSTSPSIVPYPHLPVLACNMDLLWMAEAPMPRLGHGSFLLCLEALYQKITGQKMKYTVLTGKPSEITYHHAEHLTAQLANSMELDSPLRTLYVIGDNPMTDIYGANLYNRYLASKPINVLKSTTMTTKLSATQGKKSSAYLSTISHIGHPHHPGEVPVDHIFEKCAESMESVLVCTGVYCEKRSQHMTDVDHGHRDYPFTEDLARPSIIVENVYEAVAEIFAREGFK
ncbi:haloacid dehalogenase-like hydrolase domain-containing 5 [Ptychodera flava]|uniref:haloacid dehalogenase-like hydrolase domain-containing 5 n=1 Tax=Ptychodera flava TaxID=63121 RepID=UPI00396A5CC2